MAKKNKNQSYPDDITMSLDEFDEATLKQFYSGKLRGMYKCNDITLDAIARLKQSLEDVWAIEYSGVISESRKAQAEKLTFAIDTLVTLEDMFLGEYDSELAKVNNEANGTSNAMTSEEFLQHLDDLDDDL